MKYLNGSKLIYDNSPLLTIKTVHFPFYCSTLYHNCGEYGIAWINNDIIVNESLIQLNY